MIRAPVESRGSRQEGAWIARDDRRASNRHVGLRSMALACLLLVHPPATPLATEAQAGGASPVSGAAEAGSRITISWEELRTEIGKWFCVKEIQLPDGKSFVTPIAGQKGECVEAGPEQVFSRAVEKAFGSIQPVLVALEPEGIDSTNEVGIPLDERTRLLREAYLDSEDFLLLFLPHLEAELADAGLSCEGCPQLEKRPLRRIHWDDVAPYVAAHAWPDPVRSVVGEDGKPKEKHAYGIHFCAGLNGISEMANPDPLFVRVGFVGMYHTDEARTIASSRFKSILSTESFKTFTDDDSRTAYLRRRLSQELIADQELRAAVCLTLTRYARDLGVLLEGCRVDSDPVLPACPEGKVPTERGCLTPPLLLKKGPDPIYPVSAREAKVGGEVILLLLVNANGDVQDIRVTESTSPGYGLEEAAIASARDRKYKPAEIEGEPVEWETPFVVDFKTLDY